MLLLTVTEFRNNISKYLKMAITEHIAIKGRDGVIELTPSKSLRVNPSPSGDKWFDNAQNLSEVEQALQQSSEGEYKVYQSEEELDELLGL